MLIDTHCHLADPAFAADREAVVDRAVDAGVAHVVVIGESPDRAREAMELARADQRLSATAGLHPHEATAWSPETAAWLRQALADPVVIAAGEMGLDYHYDHSPRDTQRAVFDAQLDLARQAGVPAVIHAREADDDVAALLRNHPRTVAILHSFSSGSALLTTGIALGHYVSFSGMITFRNWALDEAIREVPDDRLLVETDAPYLAPVPFRGKRNEPAYVARVAARVAEVTGRSVDDVVAMTGRNAARVFGSRLSPPSPTKEPS